MLEFSCHANQGGRFLEVSEYHSGNQRGSIRVPEGRRGAGWLVFEFQVRKSFLGETKQLPLAHAPPRQANDAGVGVEEKLARNHAKRRRFRKAQYSRSTKSAPYLIPSVTSHNSTGFYSKTQVRMVENEPRPTWTQLFVWKPISKTL